MIESICSGGLQLALILRASYYSSGVNFFTPDDYSQQLGYMNRPKGYVIAPHVHNPVERAVSYTKEVLFIKSGKLRVDFYTENQTYIESKMLHAGDVVLLAFGGHGFEVVEDSEIIEVKQGPYAGDQDKTRFDPVESNKIKLVIDNHDSC